MDTAFSRPAQLGTKRQSLRRWKMEILALRRLLLLKYPAVIMLHVFGTDLFQ